MKRALHYFWDHHNINRIMKSARDEFPCWEILLEGGVSTLYLDARLMLMKPANLLTPGRVTYAGVRG